MNSQLCTTDIILDVDAPNDVLKEIIDRQSGYVARDIGLVPFGSQPGVRSFPDKLLMSWDEIKERIKERAEKKERASDYLIGQKIPGTHQGRTSFCWYHSAVQPMRSWRAKRGLPFIDLCAAYGACRVQNFRNEGYWTSAAVSDLSRFGTVTTAEYPENAFDRQRHKACDDKPHHLIDDAVDIETYQQLLSLLCADGGAGGGWSWMGHAMELIEGVLDGGNVHLRVRDNYYGDRDMYVITGSQNRVCPDDMVGILSVKTVPQLPG